VAEYLQVADISTFPRLGTKWFQLQGGKNHHPLGFNWHPLEGANIYIYVCVCVCTVYIYVYIYTLEVNHHSKKMVVPFG